MSRNRPPLWFAIAAILLVFWGLAGVFACIQQWRLGAEAMGPATAYDRALFASLPTWYTIVYAIATGAGLLAAIALLARQASAEELFIVSLVAIVVQFGWLFANTDIVAMKGAAVVLPFPILIVLVAAFGVWMSRLSRRRGWTH